MLSSDQYLLIFVDGVFCRSLFGSDLVVDMKCIVCPIFLHFDVDVLVGLWVEELV